MKRARVLTFTIIAFSIAGQVRGQDNVRITGLAYLDYEYTLSSPDEAEEGENGFGYRRLYLTTDVTLSDNFSMRARLEANDGSTTAQGRPAPFVKDLYVRWNDSFAEGHDIFVGISPPPSFTVSERVWGYRSLEKTIQDRVGEVSSRDFGVAVRGRLDAGGKVRYGVMFANNSGVSREDDKHKRVYGQLEIRPSDGFTVTLGVDYASYDDERDDAINGNAFAGYIGDGFAAGIEGFYTASSLADVDATEDHYGLSFFGRVNLNENVTVVSRFDRVEFSGQTVEVSETFILGGIALRPHNNVEFIPNVLVSKFDGDDTAFVSGRVTVHARF